MIVFQYLQNYILMVPAGLMHLSKRALYQNYGVILSSPDKIRNHDDDKGFPRIVRNFVNHRMSGCHVIIH
jgi:hypothetical protein